MFEPTEQGKVRNIFELLLYVLLMMQLQFLLSQNTIRMYILSIS